MGVVKENRGTDAESSSTQNTSNSSYPIPSYPHPTSSHPISISSHLSLWSFGFCVSPTNQGASDRSLDPPRSQSVPWRFPLPVRESSVVDEEEEEEEEEAAVLASPYADSSSSTSRSRSTTSFLCIYRPSAAAGSAPADSPLQLLVDPTVLRWAGATGETIGAGSSSSSSSSSSLSMDTQPSRALLNPWWITQFASSLCQQIGSQACEEAARSSSSAATRAAQRLEAMLRPERTEPAEHPLLVLQGRLQLAAARSGSTSASTISIFADLNHPNLDDAAEAAAILSSANNANANANANAQSTSTSTSTSSSLSTPFTALQAVPPESGLAALLQQEHQRTAQAQMLTAAYQDSLWVLLPVQRSVQALLMPATTLPLEQAGWLLLHYRQQARTHRASGAQHVSASLLAHRFLPERTVGWRPLPAGGGSSPRTSLVAQRRQSQHQRFSLCADD
jgi:hypothetical protein